MRKHVKPAHPQAAIPDPVRGGDLPPEGLTVDWSVHWARLAQRGDIVVTDVAETDAPAEPKRAGPTAKNSAARGSKAKPHQRKVRMVIADEVDPAASKPGPTKSRAAPFPPKALTEATQRDTVSAITSAGAPPKGEAPPESGSQGKAPDAPKT